MPKVPIIQKPSIPKREVRPGPWLNDPISYKQVYIIKRLCQEQGNAVPILKGWTKGQATLFIDHLKNPIEK